MKASLDKANIVHQDQALRQAAGQPFYNTSQFTLRDLRARSCQSAAAQGLRVDPSNFNRLIEQSRFRTRLSFVARPVIVRCVHKGP